MGARGESDCMYSLPKTDDAGEPLKESPRDAKRAGQVTRRTKGT